MKKILLFAPILVLLFSCKNNTPDPGDPGHLLPGERLTSITVRGKVDEAFEYKNGRLAKESNFGDCDTPFMIHDYTYEAGNIIKSSAAVRGVYSSVSTALCNPEGPYDTSIRRLKYDESGRLTTITGEASTVSYLYNGQVITSKQINNQTGEVYMETVIKTDTNGNIIEVSNTDAADRGVTRYEYDDKINPRYKIRSMKIGIISPFESSPNNVIKSFDNSGRVLWERKFSYNIKGLPVQCLESNGITYDYHYQ